MTNDKVKFWSVLIAMMLGACVAVLLIDMSIKAAILEESNALRRVILGVQGERKAEASPDRAADQSASPGSVLGFPATGMEAANVPGSD